MSQKRFKVEQIVRMLREAEVGLSKGQTVTQVSRKLGITDQTYYRWRKEYSEMKVVQAKRLKELEDENGKLKRLVTDLSLKLKRLVDDLSLDMGKNQPSILIVDDQKFFCSSLEDFLKEEGYEPNSVHNGYDAIEEVKKNQYDVVFLDVNMPGIDGIKTLNRIKKINNNQIVIMITARDDMDTITKMLKGGADDYIQKPIANEELLRALHSVNGKRNLILKNRALHVKLRKK